jgi:ATP-binding cassette subfamily B protein
MSADQRKQRMMPAGIGRRGPGGGGMHSMMRGEKARDFKGSMIKLIGYLGAFRLPVILVGVLAIASAVFTIIGPKMLGGATDTLLAGIGGSAGGGIDFAKIVSILLTLVCIYILGAVFSYAQGFIMTGITTKITFRMRNDISAKMHTLPFSYYDSTTHGDVISRITNDVDTISQTLNHSLSQIITSITSIAGVLIMMISMSWQLTLVSLCVIPLSMIAILIVVRKSQSYFKAQQDLLGSVNGHIEEMFGNHTVIKAFNGEADSLRVFDGYNGALYTSAWKANFLSGLLMPITGFIGNLAYVAVCIMGAYLTLNGKMTIGGIQAFLQYIRSFMQPINQIANISNVLQQTAAAAERVFEFLAEEEELRDTEESLPLVPHTATRRDIRFENVSFGYGAEESVIHNFSATIQGGQKIAIVGPTGAGKTTIVKLLMRFYDVSGGRILLGDTDIRSFKRRDFRKVFGMVLQDAWLFSATIADNIRYGKLDSPDEAIEAASRAAQADYFIRTLPDGYNMVLNEETGNISQGQKQLLTIARTILSDPEILILDEATSNVDTRTEVLLQSAMDSLLKNRTSFVIAHRLSTIRNADLILVMQNGDIVEQGSHPELLAKGGFYTSLYNSQFAPIMADKPALRKGTADYAAIP